MTPPEGSRRADTIVVEEATIVEDDLVAAFSALIPQLSSSSAPPGRPELEKIVASEASVLLVARDEKGGILGSMTLVLFRVPTGVRAWIEDVVVDDRARGKGVGEALVRAALARASAAGARSVDLTSRPTRESANRLYRRLGFEPRQTNIYRWSEPAVAPPTAETAEG